MKEWRECEGVKSGGRVRVERVAIGGGWKDWGGGEGGKSGECVRGQKVKRG